MDNIIFYILASVIAILFGYGMYVHFTLPADTISNEQIKNRQERFANSNYICPNCSHKLTAETIFCPKCSTITPRVREVLNSYPTKKPADYLAYSDDDGYTCPLCRQNKIRNKKASFYTPIVCCPHCFGYFLKPNKSEPYNSEPPSILSSIGASFVFSVYLCIMAWYFFELSIETLSVLFCVAITLLTAWDIVSWKRLVSDSARRFEQNPDYPQILADMGYLHNLNAELRANLKKYGPNGEVRCEYCNQLSITDDSHCPHCNAPLPTQRYCSPAPSIQRATTRPQHTTTYYKNLVLAILLAFITALIIWALL